ncbi:MAG TPA: hypothetical protein VNW99_08665 [Cytophagaceae bacterium]|jgi:hypothetical protein|nr:hypothetical protein [Cytophagaceae bacterium]
MFKIVYLEILLVFFSSCSMLHSSRNSSGSVIKGVNVKEAQKIQKENYKNYTNSYNYKMQQEVDRRHKDELRRSKFVHKNKAL